MEKAKQEEEIEQITPNDPLLEYFNNAYQILNSTFILQKEKEKSDFENFKQEYQIDNLTDEIDQGKITEMLELYFGGENKNFLKRIRDLSPDKETMFFTEFLATNFGSCIMKENNSSIHIDTGDLYYNGVNTGESIYDFVLSRKNFSKKLLNAKLYYDGTFEECLSKFLAGFDANADERPDTLTNKSINYLFCRYNDSLVFAGIEPASVIHTKVSADEIVLQNLQNRDWQYLIESIIHKVEKENDHYKIKTTEDTDMV